MKRKAIATKHLVALLALMGAVPLTRAQYREWIEQPENYDWYAVPRVQYLRTDVEAEQDKMQSSGSTANQDTSRVYVSPRIGIAWDNYLYHPYLLTYSMLFEPGYVWQNRTSNGKTTETDELVLDGTFRANVLQIKPYATTLSYSHSHEEAKYGFFSTATVDSQSWGATSGYRDGPVPVEVSFLQSHEDSTDFNQDTLTDQTLLNLHAHNDRARDNSTLLDYQFSQFDRTTKGVGYDFTTKSTYNHASVADVEHFDHSQLQSSARVNSVGSSTSSSTDVNTIVNYTIDHGNGLNSFYDYSLSAFSGNNSDSLQNYVVAGVQHQLYESLHSSVEVHGSQLNSSAPGSKFDYQTAGTTAAADYSKHLGGWGHLYLNNSSSYNLTDQQTTGSEIQINNESHVVPLSGTVVLSQPRDTALISVTDKNSVPLQPGDYTLIQTTDPWRIQINSAGPSHIQPGDIILVSYTYMNNPSGNYSTFANQSQIRLTFWHDYLGVYARYTLTENHASSKALFLENDELFEVGADFTRDGLNFSASYIDEHSTFYDNLSYNLAENYSMSVSANSSVGLNFNQQWIVNSSSSVGGAPATPQQHMTFYNFMAHYDWRPRPRFSWNTEAGYQRQEGFGLDQNLFAARTYLNWYIGKLEFHAGYQHQNQQLPQERRESDFIFLQVKRDF